MYKNHMAELAFRNVRTSSSQESHPPRLQNVLNVWKGKHSGEKQYISTRSGHGCLQSLYKSSGPSGAKTYLGVAIQRGCTVERGQRIIKNKECKLRHSWVSIPPTPLTRYMTLGKILYRSPPQFLNNKMSCFEDEGQNVYIWYIERA